jgi:hypothetical protein
MPPPHSPCCHLHRDSSGLQDPSPDNTHHSTTARDLLTQWRQPTHPHTHTNASIHVPLRIVASLKTPLASSTPQPGGALSLAKVFEWSFIVNRVLPARQKESLHHTPVPICDAHFCTFPLTTPCIVATRTVLITLQTSIHPSPNDKAVSGQHARNTPVDSSPDPRRKIVLFCILFSLWTPRAYDCTHDHDDMHRASRTPFGPALCCDVVTPGRHVDVERPADALVLK